MNKIKLRKKSNSVKIRSNNAFHIKYQDRENIRLITKFNCEENFVYLNSITFYKDLPYITHDLWVEVVDQNTSRLMVKWSSNQIVIRDLEPFWKFCDFARFQKGLCPINYAEFNTLDEILNYCRNDYYNIVKKGPKEKYLEYRLKQSEKRSFYWWELKQQKVLAKRIKNGERINTSKKYTWRD